MTIKFNDKKIFLKRGKSSDLRDLLAYYFFLF